MQWKGSTQKGHQSKPKLRTTRVALATKSARPKDPLFLNSIIHRLAETAHCGRTTATAITYRELSFVIKLINGAWQHTFKYYIHTSLLYTCEALTLFILKCRTEYQKHCRVALCRKKSPPHHTPKSHVSKKKEKEERKAAHKPNLTHQDKKKIFPVYSVLHLEELSKRDSLRAQLYVPVCR